MWRVFVGILVVVGLIVGVVGGYGLWNQSKEREIDLTSRVDTLRIEFKDKERLASSLGGMGLWNQDGVNISGEVMQGTTAKNLIIEIVPSIDDPSFIQNDTEGRMVIASKFNVSPDGIINVWIAPGEFLISKDGGAMAKWFDEEFWRIIRPIIPSSRDIEHFEVFEVTKVK